MIKGVLIDMTYFLAYYFLFILFFGILFAILFANPHLDEYNGLNLIGYLVMNYRLSLGDFSTDYIPESKAKLIPFIWIIWGIAVLLLNIIFMNFIIAVISQTYEKVIQKSTAESYKLKSILIAEREQIMTEK